MPATVESRILVTQAEPGMVLSRHVLLVENRQILVKEGTVLVDSVIDRIMVRGIKRIWIQGPFQHGPQPLSYGEELKHLAERFSRVQHVPLMGAMKLSIARVLGKRA